MKIGDVVNLKSGGWYLTVSAIDGDSITCIWIDEAGVPHEIEVPSDTLEKRDVEDTV